ncbi:MAG: sigma-54 interaction domain-containing protein [Dethiobacteria bacterium]
MATKRAVVVGSGRHTKSIYRILKESEKIEVIGIADLEGSFSWLQESEQKNIFCTNDLVKLLSLPEVELIINTVDKPQIKEQLKNLKTANVELVNVVPGSFLQTLLQFSERLLKSEKTKGGLWEVLNTVQDAVEIVDSKGIINYTNPAFTRVTGIAREERVGKNIFEVSPNGALASSLLRQKPVVGYRTKVGGSDVEVISNASPIVIDGEIIGAVVVFQPITDILKLMEELQKSTAIIENLYAEIDQITRSKYSFKDLYGQGKSKIFQETLEMAKKAAKGDSPVLITGESGTGKEIYAHAIHQNSSRRGKPFIKADLAFIPDAMLETDFFGYEKGAFAGAAKPRLGKVEMANGGTLFIDGLREIPAYFQDKLLRLIKEKEFERAGAEQPTAADVRIIASTNFNLKELIRKGVFKEELYLHLSIFEINIPPLRKRIEDISLIIENLIPVLNRKLGKNVKEVSPAALQILCGYEWPGNIRELERVIERAMALVDGTVIEERHLSPYIGKFSTISSQPFTEVIPLDKMEQMMLKTALSRFGETLEGKKKAAQALNISLATLYNKLKKYKASL